jgi:hypothetical protein
MRAITAAILGFGFVLATEANATDPRCVWPEQPPGTGNSMLTWRIPDDSQARILKCGAFSGSGSVAKFQRYAAVRRQ